MKKLTTLFNTKDLKGIGAALLDHKENIAVAESATSGMIQLALSTAVDASKFYQGGITTYNLGQKSRHLKIEPIHALSCNCVSAQVAAEMASGVSSLFNSHWGIGVTGYAAPVKESRYKQFAYFAITKNNHVAVAGKLETKNTDPLNAQLYFTTEVLKALLLYIENHRDSPALKT
jgi:nicotinamide-nucleotide amidase